MSMRDEFEKLFPVPKDVEWIGNGYAPTKYSADQGYNRMWKVWKAAQAPASGEVERRPLPVNRYGVDRDYFTKKLEILIRDMRDYTPAELARSLGRLAITADSETMREPEFDIGDLADQPKCRDTHPPAKVPEGWSVRRVNDRITIQHPDFGGYCADLNADDKSQIAPVILYHLAEALLTTPTPATTPPPVQKGSVPEETEAMVDAAVKVFEDAGARVDLGWLGEACRAYVAASFTTPPATTPEAEWVRCADRLPEPRKPSRKSQNGVLIKFDNGRISRFREVSETLIATMKNGPRQALKFETPNPPRIVEWMDLDSVTPPQEQ